MPKVKALKSFNGRPEEGGYVKRGATLEIDAKRAAELTANGLVHEIPAEKKAPQPENKMAPKAANKGRRTVEGK
jgi:hypothetical protein